MSWQELAPTPPSVNWLEHAPTDAVTYDLFLQVCDHWVAWQRALGVTDHMQEPRAWCNPGDLQTFSNVVNWWPTGGVPTHLRAPTLVAMLNGLRVLPQGLTESFAEHLDRRKALVAGHIAAKGGDTANPNETADERAARKNRERQARWQLKHAAASADPVKNELIEAARSEANKLSEWKATLRTYTKEQKLACDAAVRAAKQARDDNISTGERAVAEQEVRMLAAKEALSNYNPA